MIFIDGIHDLLEDIEYYKKMFPNSYTCYELEKPREFDPRGQATMTPAGKNTLTPYGKIKMTPENDCFSGAFL